MTSSTPLSPESRTTPATPGSPPSEISAPLSSLAISVPSVALSPSGEEERPLLLSNTCQLHKSSIRDEQKRSSAHYNHGHVAHSLPPSPLFTMENNYQVIGDHDTTAAGQEISASPEKIIHTNNNISDCSTKRAVITNGHVLHNVESSGDSMLASETEEPKGEHTAFLLTDSTTALLLRAMDSSRTNPASSDDDMQVKSSSSTT
ncbi:pro-neuregulin-1, membrane-bound isoform-like [Lates japonicus]